MQVSERTLEQGSATLWNVLEQPVGNHANGAKVLLTELSAKQVVG